MPITSHQFDQARLAARWHAELVPQPLHVRLRWLHSTHSQPWQKARPAGSPASSRVREATELHPLAEQMMRETA